MGVEGGNEDKGIDGGTEHSTVCRTRSLCF